MFTLQIGQQILASLFNNGGQQATELANTDIVQSFTQNIGIQTNAQAPIHDFTSALKNTQNAPAPAPKRSVQPKDHNPAPSPKNETQPEPRKNAALQKADTPTADEQTPQTDAATPSASDNQPSSTSANNAANTDAPAADPLQKDIQDTLDAAKDAVATIEQLLALFGNILPQPVIAQLQQSQKDLSQFVQGLQQLDVNALRSGDPQSLANLQQLLQQFRQLGASLEQVNQQFADKLPAIANFIQGENQDVSAEITHKPFAELLQKVQQLQQHIASQLQSIADGLPKQAQAAQHAAPEALAHAKPFASPQQSQDAATLTSAAQTGGNTQDQKILNFPNRGTKEAPFNPVVDANKQADAVATLQTNAIQQIATANNTAAQDNDGPKIQTSASNAPFAAAQTSAAQQKNNAVFQNGLKPEAKGSASEQVAFQMKSMVKNGVSKMVVHLDPIELGKLEIKMQIGRDGKVDVSIQVERPETLQMLQKDARFLQQSLSDAGLNAEGGSLSFNLKGENSGGQQRQGHNPYPVAVDDHFDEDLLTIATEQYTTTVQHGVNIRI